MFCRPKELLRREAILRVARDIFCNEGYAATSMSTIAARLGGSKATLYKYFRSKEELFAASLDDLIANFASFPDLPEVCPETLEPTLMSICRKVTHAMISPPLLALFRLVVSESPRFPEIGQAYYDRVVLPGQRRIAEFLQCCVDQGLIKAIDPMIATGQLIALCRNTSYFRALTNLPHPPTIAEIDEEADLAAKTFLTAFGHGGSTA